MISCKPSPELEGARRMRRPFFPPHCGCVGKFSEDLLCGRDAVWRRDEVLTHKKVSMSAKWSNNEVYGLCVQRNFTVPSKRKERERNSDKTEIKC